MTLSMKENMVLFMDRKIPEWFPNYRTEVCPIIPSCVHERAPGDGTPAQLLGGTGVDWFGVNWLFEPNSGGSMVDPSFPPVLNDISKWKEVVQFPNLDKIDWASARKMDDGRIDENKFCVVTILNGPFERMHALMSMVEANCALLTDPEESFGLLMAIADYKIKLIDKIVEYYPVDMIEVHDDWGHQRNSFMSPDTWRNLIAPAMEKIIQHIKSKGIFAQVHSCGKVEPLIEDMINIGIDHWSSCQACNDIPGIIAGYGDQITCLGGMDTSDLVDPSVPREELKKRIEKRFKLLAKGGGLLPYGSRSYPILIELINEVIAENRDFLSNSENQELPHLQTV
ncbi:hypothetical protein J0B03_07410 [Alkalibacter rhizosphaerae]|uniref:Uroporphyrinogen decarboxylase (URO-D) domain-containing protein n=1 Tax=Alkalibacter rhizosphaerae TaxID=2815577 RepID=A0A974XDD6_9FIRM|nr:uroporphyrinogen decarboxylase family protein [Alkalibacter rhizosphaerae]QSX07661.1 hypothetical protein J0B03_07410 [Alkalibacter rhizosphaerae]